jgi:hypothetical protein
VDQGRISANTIFQGGSPLTVSLVWAYDSAYEGPINDDGSSVSIRDVKVYLTCPQGTPQLTYARGVNNAYSYFIGVPFPTNLPNAMPTFATLVCEQPPACGTSVSVLDFGRQTTPEGHQLSFQVCNNGGGTLVGTVVENCETFSVVSGADYNLAAGACQTVVVEFVGIHAGPTTCDLLLGDCTVTCFVIDDVAATEVPAVFALAEAYPNPFNPSTTLSYSVPENQEVTLNVYNTSGQLVRTLVNGMVERGEHKVVFDASDLASGVYVYTLKSATQSAMHKMVLVK